MGFLEIFMHYFAMSLGFFGGIFVISLLMFIFLMTIGFIFEKKSKGLK